MHACLAFSILHLKEDSSLNFIYINVRFLSVNLVLQHLKQQQEGLQHLISIIKDDLDDLLLIEHGLTEKKTHLK